MALDIIEGQDMTWAEAVREAAQATGGEIIFVLPEPGEDGAPRHRAMVRLTDEDAERLIVVAEREGGYDVHEEPDIDEDLLQFARASIEVLERLRADEAVIAPLVSQPH